MLGKTKKFIQKASVENTFAKNVIVLMGGTVGAQGLLIIAAPFLTRIYTPEDFGLFAVYVSILTIISVISCLRYEIAIPLPKDSELSVNMVVLCLLLLSFMTGLFSIFIFFYGSRFSKYLGAEEFSSYLWLLPFGIFITGLFNICTYWSIRQKNFVKMSSARVSQTILTITVQLGGYTFGAVSLAVGQILGQFLGIFILGKNVFYSLKKHNVSWRLITFAGKRYIKFPTYSSWETFFNTASVQLPPIIFSIFYGPLVVGLYALSSRVLMLPSSVIGSAISQVFLSSAPEAYRKGELGSLVNNIHSKLAFLIMPPIICLMLIGPELFSFVFGNNWKEAGVVAQWMGPWIYFQFVSSPISTVFAVCEKLKEAFIFESISCLIRILAIAIGVYLEDFILAVAIFSLTSAFSYVVLYMWSMKIAHSKLSFYFEADLKALGLSTLCLIPLFLIVHNIVDYERVSHILLFSLTSILLLLYYFLYFLLTSKKRKN